ncbi:MAG: single-stranded-DNA-specific exonuclease RecJ [Verrucomicrobia bacterium]|nr:single-stranded-DNA-specific exonuclease RecJ [Verrucomicrobiota bacterium]
MTRWAQESYDENLVTGIRDGLQVSSTLARLLISRGAQDCVSATAFLEPKLAGLQDPFNVANMGAAVTRLRQAMAKDEKIIVYGDYDVDGVTSTVLLISVLNRYGIHPRYFVPMRLEEGYGLSSAGVERALQDGKPDLLIAVDCGTSSHSEVAQLRSQGIDVIIIDHHTSKESLPKDCIIVNPHVNDPEDSPWRHLCTVGLIFKFMHALIKELRQEGDELAHEIRLRDYLDLVALGAIADLVPLTGENRILVKTGLNLLKDTRRLGLCALFQVGGIQPGTDLTPFDISFRLGPRINASGRLADASEPIEMLLSEDWQRCLQAARLLDDCNRERQEIERQMAEEAESMVESFHANDPALVVFNANWHAGVVGIVASRLTQKYHRPAIVLGSEGEMAKGSGRSVAGVNLVEVLKPCASLLDKWGGHPMAVGVSIRPENIAALRESFCASILEHCAEGLPERELLISDWLALEDFNEALLADLDRLAPFGQGNPEPVFGLAGISLRNIVCFGQGHFRFMIERADSANLFGVAWKQQIHCHLKRCR